MSWGMYPKIQGSLAASFFWGSLKVGYQTIIKHLLNLLVDHEIISFPFPLWMFSEMFGVHPSIRPCYNSELSTVRSPRPKYFKGAGPAVYPTASRSVPRCFIQEWPKFCAVQTWLGFRFFRSHLIFMGIDQQIK